MFDASEILRRASKRYSECASYSDFGTVKQSDNKNSIKYFRTYFVRPNKFRFEWIGYHPYFGKKGGENFYALWSDGERTFVSFDFQDNRVEEVENLRRAAAGASGISSGAVWTIYCLLNSEESACESEFLHLSDYHPFTPWPFGDKRCYALRGTSCRDNGGDTDIWIRRSDFSLHKIRQRKIITVANVEKNLAELTERNPELYEKTKGITRPRRDRRYVTETEYRSVEFDIAVSPDVFTSGTRTLYL
jgi:hypothetical protein